MMYAEGDLITLKNESAVFIKEELYNMWVYHEILMNLFRINLFKIEDVPKEDSLEKEGNKLKRNLF